MAPASSICPLLSLEKAIGWDELVAKCMLTVPDLPSCPWERDPKRGTLQSGGEAHQPVVPWVSLLILKDGLNMWQAVLLMNVFNKSMQAVALRMKPGGMCVSFDFCLILAMAEALCSASCSGWDQSGVCQRYQKFLLPPCQGMPCLSSCGHYGN